MLHEKVIAVNMMNVFC